METELLDFSNLNNLYELGIMYYYGLKVQKDRVKAFHIFSCLADKKYMKASIMLKQMKKVEEYKPASKKKLGRLSKPNG